MSLTDRGMGMALRTLRRVAGMPVLDRHGLRASLERAVGSSARRGGLAAGATARAFTPITRLAHPARQRPTRPPSRFDLTPTDEQRMLIEAFGAFADERLRPVAQEADAQARPPDDVLAGSLELGTLQLAVPTELGGVVDERSAVTSVLAYEQLARGDMGLAVACLAPAAVAGALGLWGDAGQQATYLAAFTGERPPAAALAVLEPRPVFDPLAPATTARRDGGDLLLRGEKSLVPGATDAELLLVAVEVEGEGPALVLVESGAEGVLIAAEPAMGVRAAATGRLHLDDVRVPATARLADGDADVYRECMRRARLGWCALAVGTAQAVLDHVIPYVNERETFGEPISHRQSVAFAVADMATELDGMRLATYRAASLADRDEPFATVAASARSLCADRGAAIGSAGVQLLGGHGYVKEHPVERWYRDLRAIGVMEGALLV